ncbi:6352_t:CDS:2, partial [Cetraspora pellucida]
MPGTDVINELCEVNGQENLQMDAESFLPLMLQAQDLVSKLESRVLELEKRNQLLQELGEKDEYIHDLKTKASRLEFGAQGQFLDSVNLCLNYLKSAQNNQKSRKSYKRPSLPVRHDSKFSSSNNVSNYKVELVIPQLDPVSDNVVNNVITNDSVNNIKPVRKDSISGSQISLDDIPDLDDYDLDGSEDIADFDAFMSDDDNDDLNSINNINHENIIIHDNESDNENDDNESENNESDNSDNESIIESLNDSDDSLSDNDDHLSSFENHEISEISSQFHDEPEEIDYDQDDILRPSSSVSKSENFCPSCNTLLAQVDQHIEERSYLKRDLSALAISLAEEQSLCVKIQSSKESLEQEIDDWINGMFEKINQMVFDEANTREELECLNRETKGKLENALKSSGSRQDRLREMKTLLVHLDSTKQRQTAPPLNASHLSRNSVLHRSLSNSLSNNQRFSKLFGHMSPSIFSPKNPFDILLFKGKRIYID